MFCFIGSHAPTKEHRGLSRRQPLRKGEIFSISRRGQRHAERARRATRNKRIPRCKTPIYHCGPPRTSVPTNRFYCFSSGRRDFCGANSPWSEAEFVPPPVLHTIIVRFFGSPKGLPYRLIVNQRSFVCFRAIRESPLQGHLQLCTFLCRPSFYTLSNLFRQILCECFLEGGGGTLFAKKVPPQSLIKSLTDYNIGQILRGEEWQPCGGTLRAWF